MTSKDAARLQSLFAATLELPEAARSDFLERECAGDPELLRELRGLLAADAQLAGMTARPIGAALTEVLASAGPQESQTGARVGAFELREELGRGGMGSVYRAERVDGAVTQQVAIKFVRRDVLDANTIRRFQLERQLMASLDHPNIARLFDAAELDDGTPYFVMEYVAGVPISDYCQRHHLAVRERVALMRQVCAAVAEAHRKLIVHRDLKPSNILVSDGGTPKLLDFGIAKPLATALTSGDETGTAHRYFSPNYAAPEQLTGAPTGVACDIYALGLLMYELLADVRPFDFTDLSAGQIERLITEVPPPAPSVAAARAGDNDAASRARQLRGDLDGIVLRCLRKAASERYASVEQLETDLGNYLEGRPVQARGGHGWYRAQKFVRRNLISVSASVLAIVALIGGVFAFAWQARIAEQKSAELELVATFQAQMLSQVDPTKAGILLREDVRGAIETGLAEDGSPESVRTAQLAQFDAQWRHVNSTDTARRLIDRTILQPAAAAIETQFKNQPLVAATLRDVLAQRYSELGMADAAIPLRERTLLVRRRVLGENHPETLATLSGVGLLLSTHEQYDRAEVYLRDALERQRRALGESHPDTLTTISGLGELNSSQGKEEEAEKLLRAATAGRRRVLGDNDPRTLTSIHNLGDLIQRVGRVDEGEALLREALEKRRLLGEDYAETIASLNVVGMVAQYRGNADEAEALYRESLRRSRRVYGELHTNTYFALQNFAGVLRDQGKYGEAELVAKEALTTARKAFGPEHKYSIGSLNHMATMYLRQEKFEEAAPYASAALELHRRILGEKDPETLIAYGQWADVLLSREKYAETIDLVTPTLATNREVFGADNNKYRIARMLVLLVRAHTGLGDFELAERTLVEVWDIVEHHRTPAVTWRRCFQASVELYRAWDRAEPEAGHAAQLAQSQKKLDEFNVKNPPVVAKR